MKHKIFRAFTLVELIVVITILAVLATVAFISFQGYTSSSRDSVRLADLKNISKSFEINRTKGIDFPLPDKKIDISSSGTIFQYQGELSQEILNSDLNIFDGGVDPLSGDNYGYAVNSARNKFQVIGFLENQDSVGNISLNRTFADNSDKYVKSSGDSLGILLDSDTNEIIIQSGSLVEIDIDTNTGSFAIAQKNNKVEVGDSNFIYSQYEHIIKPETSCKSILYNGKSTGDGIYTINPTGLESFEVYCDMTTNGGGWIVIAMSYANETGDTSRPFNQDFSTVRDIGVGNVNNLDDNYFISMNKYSQIADINSQKEYLWLAKPRFETDNWIQTLKYNKHYISDETNNFTWYGIHNQGAKVNYNSKPLSTIDRDLDDTTNSHCASTYGSFGWYTSCHSAHYWTTTSERSICGSNENRNYGGEYYCEQNNSYGPDAAGAYNTWYSLKILVR